MNLAQSWAGLIARKAEACCTRVLAWSARRHRGWSRVVGSFGSTRPELAGAVADLGVLVPIAVALIVKNGLTPTAVLLPAGLLYVFAGLVYRLPVPECRRRGNNLKVLGQQRFSTREATNRAADALSTSQQVLVLRDLTLDRVEPRSGRHVRRGTPVTARRQRPTMGHLGPVGQG
jgi:MFS superfamily molybdate transporter